MFIHPFSEKSKLIFFAVECGGNITDKDNGIISSPNYPEKYTTSAPGTKANKTSFTILIDAQAVKLECFYIKEFLKLWFYTKIDENTLDHCTMEYFTRTAKLGHFWMKEFNLG